MATLCYLKQNGKTLMVYRNRKPNDIHKGKWNGLGGKIESGETPEECVIREVFEESGLKIKFLHLHGLLMFNDFKGKDWYVFVFTSKEFEGELLAESPEGKLEWIRNEELTDLALWPSDKVFLPWLAKDDFFSAKFNYKDDEFISHEVTFY